ncbi:MAG: PQQ-like beta-propeller repeat protein [Bacteroidetes bacterium]|nr:PQQ-like beta-propeller repeat protein [Bacteroidota bacterium]
MLKGAKFILIIFLAGCGSVQIPGPGPVRPVVSPDSGPVFSFSPAGPEFSSEKSLDLGAAGFSSGAGVSSGKFLFGTRQGKLWGVDLTTFNHGEFDAGKGNPGVLLITGITALTAAGTGKKGQLSAVNLLTGKVLWTLPGEPWLSPVVSGDTVVIPWYTGRVDLVSLSDGKKLKSLALVSPAKLHDRLLPEGRFLSAVDQRGVIRKLNAVTGQEVFRLETQAIPVGPVRKWRNEPVWCTADSAVIRVKEDGSAFRKFRLPGVSLSGLTLDQDAGFTITTSGNLLQVDLSSGHVNSLARLPEGSFQPVTVTPEYLICAGSDGLEYWVDRISGVVSQVDSGRKKFQSPVLFLSAGNRVYFADREFILREGAEK